MLPAALRNAALVPGARVVLRVTRAGVRPRTITVLVRRAAAPRLTDDHRLSRFSAGEAG